MTSCGKWLTKEEYERMSGASPDEIRRVFESSRSLTRSTNLGEYIWIDYPDSLEGENAGHVPPGDSHRNEAASVPHSVAKDESAADEVSEELQSHEPEGQSSELSTLVSRLPLSRELSSHTERALSLVERSLNAFMKMHEEVVREKERTGERAQEGMEELEQELQKYKDALRSMERSLKDKDQEIADLKMLVDILESRRTEAGSGFEVDESTRVGDIMEEQLKYVTEQQMIKDLLEN